MYANVFERYVVMEVFFTKLRLLLVKYKILVNKNKTKQTKLEPMFKQTSNKMKSSTYILMQSIKFSFLLQKGRFV